MGNNVSRQAPAGIDTPSAQTHPSTARATGTRRVTEDTLQSVTNTPATQQTPPAFSLRSPNLLNYLRGTKPPAGMVAIETRQDGTAWLTPELAASISSRYERAFSGNMLEATTRSIKEELPMPKGVWTAFFAALQDKSVKPFTTSAQALASLELVDYLTAQEYPQLKDLMQKAVRQLPALCAKSDASELLYAYEWALALADSSAQRDLAEKLSRQASALVPSMEHLEESSLLALLREPQFRISAKDQRALLNAWATVHQDLALLAILDGSHGHASTITGPDLSAYKEPRAIASIPDWMHGAKRVFAREGSRRMNVATHAGVLMVGDERRLEQQHVDDLEVTHDHIIQNGMHIMAGSADDGRTERRRHTGSRSRDVSPTVNLIIERPTGVTHQLRGDRCTAIDFDGTHVATALANGVVTLVEAQSGSCKAAFHGFDQRPRAVYLTPTHVCVLGIYDELRVWPRDSDVCAHAQRDVASFTPHGDDFVVTDHSGRTSVYAAWRDRLLCVRSFASSVFMGPMTSDGVHIAAACQRADGTSVVESWDVVKGERVSEVMLASHAQVSMVQATPRGLAIGDVSGALWLCDEPHK